MMTSESHRCLFANVAQTQYPDEAEMCGPCGYRFRASDQFPTLHIAAPYVRVPAFRAMRLRLESVHVMRELTWTCAPERECEDT